MCWLPDILPDGRVVEAPSREAIVGLLGDLSMPESLFEEVSLQPAYQIFRRSFAERKLPFVVVCGAGLSRPACLPSWLGLRQKLEYQARTKVQSLNRMGVTYQDGKLKSALNVSDHWVSFELLADILGAPTFRDLVVEYLSPKDHQTPPQGYLDLMRLRPRGVVSLNLGNL